MHVLAGRRGCWRRSLMFRAMPARQKYRLRARSDREVIREVEPGMTYVDKESGEPFEVVGKVPAPRPLAQ